MVNVRYKENDSTSSTESTTADTNEQPEDHPNMSGKESSAHTEELSFSEYHPAGPELIDYISNLIKSELSKQMHGYQIAIQQQISMALSRATEGNVNPTVQTSGTVKPNTIQHAAAPQSSPPMISQQQQNLLHPLPPQPASCNAHNYPELSSKTDYPTANCSNSTQVYGIHAPVVSEVDVTKWGIKFDGSKNGISAEDFIFRVEILCQDFNISEEDIRRNIFLLLEGKASDWYWNQRRLNRDVSWAELVSAFLTHFRRYESDFEILIEMLDRRQGDREPFGDFLNVILKLRNQQRTPYSEKDMVEIIRRNLRYELKSLLFPIRTDSLNEFCQRAKSAENFLASQRQREESDLNHTEVAQDNNKCWNCKKTGHTFLQCPEETKEISCSKCGFEDVATPNCPNCRENQRHNPPHTRNNSLNKENAQ